MKKVFLLLIAGILIASCKKNNKEIVPAPPLPVDDRRTVLLKEIIAQRLPSPYFHFIYDSLHYATQISFASDLNVYNVEYETGRVKRMTNIHNGNSLEYTYTNNNVSEINEFFATTGKRKFRYQFEYNNGQLMQVLWFDYFTHDTPTLFKKVLLTYQADGNLASIDRYYNSTGELLWSSRHQFSNYDIKTNVDDFYLPEDFFDTFLFLPQVKFQKNNPQREVITSETNEFEVTYQYNYNNDLPVRKTGIVLQTRGANAGQPIQIFTFFNYY